LLIPAIPVVYWQVLFRTRTRKALFDDPESVTCEELTLTVAMAFPPEPAPE
jgi:hypothetical protein